jgi:hypothetical protein
LSSVTTTRPLRTGVFSPEIAGINSVVQREGLLSLRCNVIGPSLATQAV